MKEGEPVEKRVLSAGLHVSTPESQVLLSVVLVKSVRISGTIK